MAPWDRVILASQQPEEVTLREGNWFKTYPVSIMPEQGFALKFAQSKSKVQLMMLHSGQACLEMWSGIKALGARDGACPESRIDSQSDKTGPR